jgi:Family of unknown function (DUF6194)
MMTGSEVSMNEAEITQYITDTFNDIKITVHEGNSFYSYDPEQKFPFATLMTNDVNDQASDLSRPGIFRLNIGVSRDTYQSLFGAQPAWGKDGGVVDTGHDFTVLDQFMPHPIYAPMSWICILNPSEANVETVKKYLAEAYELDVKKYAKRVNTKV